MALDKGKATKILSKSFVENNANITIEDAQELMVRAEQKIREIKEEANNDSNLSAARQVVKDLLSAYSAAKKYEEAKINFLLDRIVEIEGQLAEDKANDK